MAISDRTKAFLLSAICSETAFEEVLEILEEAQVLAEAASAPLEDIWSEIAPIVGTGFVQPLPPVSLGKSRILFFGGEQTFFGDGERVYPSPMGQIYDATDDSWTAIADLPGGIPSESWGHGGFAIRLKNGKVLVGGDHENKCFLYDVSTDSWETTGDFPVGSYGWFGSGPNAVLMKNGNVLVTNRFVRIGEGGTTGWNRVFIYDAEAGTWSEGASYPIPTYSVDPPDIRTQGVSGAVLVAVPDGRVLLLGGHEIFLVEDLPDNPGQYFLDQLVARADCYAYDYKTDSWETLASMPVVHNDWNLFDYGTTPRTQTDPSSLTDSPLVAAFGAGGRALPAFALLPGNRLLVAGGVGAGFLPRFSCLIYDIKADTWSRTDDMPEPSGNAVWGQTPSGDLLVCLGLNEWNNTSVKTAIFDQKNEVWIRTADFPTAARDLRGNFDISVTPTLDNGGLLPAAILGPPSVDTNTDGSTNIFPNPALFSIIRGGAMVNDSQFIVAGGVLFYDIETQQYFNVSNRAFKFTFGASRKVEGLIEVLVPAP